MQWARKQTGFTIVELLIVVVVIAILAAITVVAYNGIQNRAKRSSFASSLSGAAKKLELAKVDTSNGAYPDPGTYTISGSGSASFSFLLADANTYCITMTQAGEQYGLAKGSVAQPGSCVVNIVKNPKGIGAADNYSASGWFTPLGTTTDATGVSWGGRADWHRFVWTGVGNGIKRLYVDVSDLQNAQSYTASVLVANPGASSFSFGMDFSDQGSNGFTLAPGETRRVSVTGVRATYDAIYRFIDIDGGGTAATGLLITDVMLTRTDAAVAFGDGDTPGWVWTGAAGLTKSLGPSL
jgi:prepilin-type N-terminal cleavage/methylation domain-containing protein